MNNEQQERADAPGGVVVTYSGTGARRDGHERSTRIELARRLAALTRCVDGGEFDPRRNYNGRVYFLPSDTLTQETASRMGIRDEGDLFGGVVPYPFIATKTITHALPRGASYAPAGWSTEFPSMVEHVVLKGLSLFAKADALAVGRKMLADGPVRIKLATGIAGLGQFVVGSEDELVAALAPLDEAELNRSGAVIEQNLTDVVTYSVGQIRVSDALLTYYGTQFLTTNNSGVEVYGGSEIFSVAGDFDDLLDLTLPENVRLAILQACAYDSAAKSCFSGFYASRRNYDVAQGRDSSGKTCSGVLEQSWRAGGASGAEIAALEAFRADPSLRVVRAETREVYGGREPLPDDATVYFAGVDPRVGPLVKFARAQPHADPR
jgi:hypothetical protein